MRKMLLAVPLFLLAGCAGVFGKPSPVVEVGEMDMVKDCQFLKSFQKPAGDWMGHLILDVSRMKPSRKRKNGRYPHTDEIRNRWSRLHSGRKCTSALLIMMPCVKWKR
jgi:hypothetical protein